MNQAGEHFEGSGLASTVGSQKPDDFAGFDREGDVLDGGDLFVATFKKVGEGALQASIFVGHFIDFGKVFDLDDGGHACSGAVAFTI